MAIRFQDKSSVDARTFGARIREARERLRLSQEELAEAVSKDQAAISEYESKLIYDSEGVGDNAWRTILEQDIVSSDSHPVTSRTYTYA